MQSGIITHIRQKYGNENVRLFSLYQKIGIPEIYWGCDNDVLIAKAKKIWKKINDADAICTVVMTDNIKATDILLAELTKMNDNKNQCKFYSYDSLLSDYYDKWSNTFDKSLKGILFNAPIVAATGILASSGTMKQSLPHFVRTATRIGFKTRLVIGLDYLPEDELVNEYGKEFVDLVDLTLTVKSE